MARPPHRRNEWVHFFLGHPVRFLMTLAGLFVLFAAVRPDLASLALYNAVNSILWALQPLIGPILGVFIAIFAIHVIVKTVFGSKKKKNDH